MRSVRSSRTVRATVDRLLPVLGIVVVLSAVLFIWDNLYLQLGLVILGILLIEAGIWQLAHPLLPSQRRYLALRNEVDDFIGLVRKLNAAAVDGAAHSPDEAQRRVDAVRAEMIESVDRMATYAGQKVAPPPVSRETV